MTYYFKKGNTYTPTSEENVDIHKALPPANYVIKVSQERGLFLETVSPFNLPSKRYGTNPRNAERVLTTFMSRENATGVMLAGEKGSGKSLLAKTISLEGAKQGIPTIVINAPFHGDAFNTLIQTIEQPAIVLFDEFEKVYDKDQQEDILTLLDGVFPSKKLFVFTCNDKWRVDVHMRNRPGRIFYMIDFAGLDASFIEEYCLDNLKNTAHIPMICKLSGLFTQFNFDMLKALIEEMNRYDESPQQALAMLNVRPEFDATKPVYSMTMATKEGDVVKMYYRTEFSGSPLGDNIDAHYLLPNPKYDPNDKSDEKEAQYTTHSLQFTPETVVNMQSHQTTLEKNGLVLTLTRKYATEKKNWLDYAYDDL